MAKSVSAPRHVKRFAFAVLENRSNVFAARKLHVGKRHSQRRLECWRNAFEKALGRYLETLFRLGRGGIGEVLELPRFLMPSATLYESDWGILQVERRKDATAYVRVDDLRWPVCEIDPELWEKTLESAG